MGLDNYFRRQAARSSGLSQTTAKLIRGALDLIFGFLPTELKAWLDGALAKDSMYVFRMGSEQCLLIISRKANHWCLSVLGALFGNR
jgi:exocyst complex component 1